MDNCLQSSMAAQHTARRNKTAIQQTLCTDYRLILNKVHEKGLITGREYNNLKSINKEDVEGHVVELVDKIMDKGEDTCRTFLDLLQTDTDVIETFPNLKDIQWEQCLALPVQSSSLDSGETPPASKKQRKIAHFKPPPTLKVKVVQLKENIQLSKYEISNGNLLPKSVDKKCTAAITDGVTARKFVLSKSLASEIKTGKCYAIKNYIISKFSPNMIWSQKNTCVYLSPPLIISSESEEEARRLLSPATAQMAIKDLHPGSQTEQLLSISGFAKSLEPVQEMAVQGGPTVPTRRLMLKEGEASIEVMLWREAALADLSLGAAVVATHLKAKNNQYGLCLHSTQYTEITLASITRDVILQGVRMDQEREQVEILDQQDDPVAMPISVWAATFGKEEVPKQVTISYENGKVIRVKEALFYKKEDCLQFSMAAQDTVRRNKTAIQQTLCTDYRLILNTVYEKGLIARREYNNLKSINKEDVEGHVVELVDKIMNKGEDTCRTFLDLLQTDTGVIETFPNLKDIQWEQCLALPVQSSSLDSGESPPESKKLKKDDIYPLNSRPVGLCVIINNNNFMDGTERRGTDKDALRLAEVFSWLGFRVLLCKDQTKDQMEEKLTFFASLNDLSQLQQEDIQEWSGKRFTHLLPEDPEHGDAFVCCILSHGEKGVVLGTDRKPLSIKHITRLFKATSQSALTGKPKVFLIQACQGNKAQHGVLLEDPEVDSSGPVYIPEEADVLVAMATVEDCVAFRSVEEGAWFIQSACQQLRERCPRGEDLATILHFVNNDVSLKEGSCIPGKKKQIPEVKYTLRKKLVLSPHDN
ncbi:uncharacterized protein LOC114449694 [Parambassis ranga]|uniref:Uncharacterized protein LOC114449694 n=1 Tax=Parambassis ranga TaxID=210632 RepID=A0A6P7K6W3_9TELE|nr:uncharacterized protein LOC114449694 [Parambassis ranga]